MRLHHPLWTHAPAASLCALMVVAFWRAWPLPDPAPVHFGANGVPDRFGEPWEMLVVLSVVSMVAIGVSVAIDETWVRQERLRRRFNWFAAFDEIGIAFLAAVTLDYLAAVAVSPPVLHLSWGSHCRARCRICSAGAVARALASVSANGFGFGRGRLERVTGGSRFATRGGRELGLLGSAQSPIHKMVYPGVWCRPGGARHFLLG